MQFLFAPGIKLMHLLRYPYKFAVIGLLAFGSIVYLFLLLSINTANTIEATRREQIGLSFERPLLTLMQELQKHRGLSSGLMNGAAAMAVPLAAQESDVQNAVAAVDAASDRVGLQLNIKAVWDTAKSHWEALRSDGGRMSAAENFEKHSGIVNEMVAMIAVADEKSGMLLDPDAASYDIMDAATIKLPATLELLARLRGHAASALASKHLDDAGRVGIAAEVAVLRAKIAELDAVLRRVETSNPMIALRVENFDAAFDKSADDILRTVSDDLVTARFSTDASKYFAAATVVIDSGFQQLQTVLLPQLDGLLQARIDSLRRQMYLGLGSALMFVLLYAYFSMSAYFAVMSSIASLADGADRIAGGDHETRIALESQDELRLVADRFNHMVDQLVRRTGQLKDSDATLAMVLADYEKVRPMAMLAAVAPAIAHDLSTPIGNANLAATTLHERLEVFRHALAQGQVHRSELEAFLADQASGINIVGSAGRRAGELVAKLKQFSIDQISERRRSFDLGQLLDEVLTTLAPTLRDQPWQIKRQVPPGLSMDSYPGPLGQVLINLVQNAAVHAFADGRQGILRIDADAPAADRVRIHVSDNGAGMSPEIQEKIFAPFFTTKLGSGGSGIGLTYARRLVRETLGGSIEVESALDKGTTFTLVLPRVAPQYQPQASSPSQVSA